MLLARLTIKTERAEINKIINKEQIDRIMKSDVLDTPEEGLEAKDQVGTNPRT